MWIYVNQAVWRDGNGFDRSCFSSWPLLPSVPCSSIGSMSFQMSIDRGLCFLCFRCRFHHDWNFRWPDLVSQSDLRTIHCQQFAPTTLQCLACFKKRTTQKLSKNGGLQVIFLLGVFKVPAANLWGGVKPRKTLKAAEVCLLCGIRLGEENMSGVNPPGCQSPPGLLHF